MELIKRENFPNLDKSKKDLERQAWQDAEDFLKGNDSLTSYGQLKQADAYLNAFKAAVYEQAKQDFEELQGLQEGNLKFEAGFHAVITERKSRITYDFSECPHVLKAETILKELKAKAVESGCATVKSGGKTILHVDLK